jgi:guanylate kinase
MSGEAATTPPLLVISGPSGVGKGTLIASLLARLPRARLAVSATTRPPRPDELDGIHYHFISEPQFAAARRAGHVVEWVSYAGYSYGTLLDELTGGQPTIVECDVRGARLLATGPVPARLIFVAPPSLSELERRLRDRATEDDANIAARLQRAREELEQAPEVYDRIVVNDRIERACDEVIAALAAGAD